MYLKPHVIAIILLPFLIAAQPVCSEPKSDFTIQVLELFRLNLSMEYELAVTADSALAARCHLLNSYDAFGLGFSGVGLGTSYRLYPFSGGKAPQGFFVGPAGEVKFLNTGSTGISAFYYSVGIEAGYRWMIGEVRPLVIAPSLALIYKSGSISDNRSLEGAGIGALLGFGLGLAFD